MVSVSYTACWLFQMSFEWFVGFADGASFHTCNLALADWVIYSPTRQVVASSGACLGPATNNVANNSVIIELIWDSISHGITFLEVIIDSQILVYHLNGVYQVRHHTLLRQFLRIRLLERNFEHIIYQHISRNKNKITDAFSNYILDWNLAHTL